jgi:hypothetical protein
MIFQPRTAALREDRVDRKASLARELRSTSALKITNLPSYPLTNFLQCLGRFQLNGDLDERQRCA